MTDSSATTAMEHIRRTLHFALPIIVARSAILIMFAVDTVMTGWAGARELAYLGLEIAPQLTFMLVSIGLLTATVVLTAQAFGAEEFDRCGRVWRAALAHAAVLGVAVVALSFLAEPFFLATGQNPEIAAGAAKVTLAFASGTPGMLLYVATNLFLEATGRPRVGMTVMLAANLLNIPLNGIFALGWGGFVAPLGAVGAVSTSAALRWTALAAVVAYVIVDARRKGDPFAVLVPVSVWLQDFARFGGNIGRRLRKLGLPMGLIQGVESAAFATVVILAGRLGEAALAAHQLTMLLVTLAFMNALGMSGATSIRVGRAVGRGDSGGLAAAGWTGIGLAAAIAVPPAILYVALPRELAGLFVSEPRVLDIAQSTVRAAGLVLVFDAMMAVTLGALRGSGDVWVPLGLQATAFWAAMVPTAWGLSTYLGIGAVGLIYGVMAGITASLALLLLRFLAVLKRPLQRV